MPVFGTVRYEQSGQDFMTVYCPTRLIYNECLKRGEKWVEESPGQDRGVVGNVTPEVQ